MGTFYKIFITAVFSVPVFILYLFILHTYEGILRTHVLCTRVLFLLATSTVYMCTCTVHVPGIGHKY